MRRVRRHGGGKPDGTDETVVQRADPDWGWTEDDPGNEHPQEDA